MVLKSLHTCILLVRPKNGPALVNQRLANLFWANIGTHMDGQRLTKPMIDQHWHSVGQPTKCQYANHLPILGQRGSAIWVIEYIFPMNCHLSVYTTAMICVSKTVEGLT